MPNLYVLREMRSSDLKQVAAIDAVCFPLAPWKAGTFRHWTREKQETGEYIDKSTAFVVVDSAANKVIGYSITRQASERPVHIELVKLGVHPGYRKKGVGSQLIFNILQIQPKKVRFLFTIVNETNVDGQLWAKGLGWTCVQVLPTGQVFETEDAYVFEIGG